MSIKASHRDRQRVFVVLHALSCASTSVFEEIRVMLFTGTVVVKAHRVYQEEVECQWTRHEKLDKKLWRAPVSFFLSTLVLGSAQWRVLLGAMVLKHPSKNAAA